MSSLAEQAAFAAQRLAFAAPVEFHDEIAAQMISGYAAAIVSAYPGATPADVEQSTQAFAAALTHARARLGDGGDSVH
jgi:sulfur transfer protein SufE